MSTQYERPASGKLTREDFNTITECDKEILNIKWILEDMDAERIAQSKIIAALGDYNDIINAAHGSSEQLNGGVGHANP